MRSRVITRVVSAASPTSVPIVVVVVAGVVVDAAEAPVRRGHLKVSIVGQRSLPSGLKSQVPRAQFISSICEMRRERGGRSESPERERGRYMKRRMLEKRLDLSPLLLLRFVMPTLRPLYWMTRFISWHEKYHFSQLKILFISRRSS